MNLPALGFGLMRLPTLSDDKDIDFSAVNEMIDCYLDSGMNYFDTAFMYHGGKSESVIKTCLAERYARDEFLVADKMPPWNVKTPADFTSVFEKQLSRCGIEYFDYYLLHALDCDSTPKMEELGGFDFLKQLIADGRARHIGFSFHGDNDCLDGILTRHPELEFVQLQINFLDWADFGKTFYNTARKHNVPVIIMEPLRGGSLTRLPEAAEDKLRQIGDSNVELAFRFVSSLPGVACTLSGMSTLAQVRQNVDIYSRFTPLNDKETAIMTEAGEIMLKLPHIGCTACNYCADCPSGIGISDVFTKYNTYLDDKNLSRLTSEMRALPEGARPSDCTACGVCQSICPQGLTIPDIMSEIAALTQ